MASLTIRNIDDAVKERLRVRAATHGRSMEEEVRLILKQATGGITGSEFVALSRRLFGEENGIDLELPCRRSLRSLPDFATPDFGIAGADQ